MNKDLSNRTKAELMSIIEEKNTAYYFEADADSGHYYLELPEEYNKTLIFNTMEQAIEYTLILKEPIKPSEIKILSFSYSDKSIGFKQT
ncbi:hypothetical protein LCGC14_1270870 [marine sediment metagenome]|uniref:Uncharacterized protein n=1 Tax=marine sediment metagenome TaxID=412755 RepID=A0A0F9KY67_9ZZZZ